MPRKITVTEDNGDVLELSEKQYTDLLRDSVSALISTPEFDNKLQGVVDKIAQRLDDVERTVKAQGEKIQKLDTKTSGLEDQLAVDRREMSQIQSDLRDLQQKLAEVEKIARSHVPVPVLDTCANSGNLQAEFKDLLAVKKKNKNQIILGPVYSKTPDDGFWNKDELEPLEDENEIAEAIRATGTLGHFVVTITSSEKRIAKVRFEGETAWASCQKVLGSWRVLRDDHHMWASPDQPVDLSKMEVNAKKFGIDLRGTAGLPSNSYVEVRDGVLFIGAIRIAPVYVFPEASKWGLIRPIVQDAIKSFMSLPWPVRKIRAANLDFTEKIWDASLKNDIG
jgi:uncharacterized coiled-coil protein SlyX